MRKLLIGVVVAAVVVLYRPWQYKWAFGQDAGAAQAADWKNKSCSKGLAATLYGDKADSAIAAKQGNRFFFPGSPGHSYFVHGFRSQKACEQARKSMGTAQWDQSRR